MAKSLNRGYYKYNKDSLFLILKDCSQNNKAKFNVEDVFIKCVDRYKIGYVYQYKFLIYQGNTDYRKKEGDWIRWSPFVRRDKHTTLSFPELIRYLESNIIKESNYTEFAKFLLESINEKTDGKSKIL